jgi:hypothetical protein
LRKICIAVLVYVIGTFIGQCYNGCLLASGETVFDVLVAVNLQ